MPSAPPQCVATLPHRISAHTGSHICMIIAVDFIDNGFFNDGVKLGTWTKT